MFNQFNQFTMQNNFNFNIPIQQNQPFQHQFTQQFNQQYGPSNQQQFQQQQQQQQSQYKLSQSSSFKQQANNFFANKQYSQALQSYTQAIQLTPKDSLLYSNRALTYKHLNDLQNALKDTNQAIQLDPNNVRAILLLSQLNLHFIKQGNNQITLEKIIIKLQDTEKIFDQFNVKPSLRLQITETLQKAQILKNILQKDLDDQMKAEICLKLKRISEKQNISLKYNDLENLLKNPDQKKITKLPEHLTCVITLDLMKEPILISSGYSYDKENLLTSQINNKREDPITRKPYDETMIPNLSISSGIKWLKLNNPLLSIESESIHCLNELNFL